MAYSGLTGFISALEKKDELLRIKTFTDPILEITEITDRVTKSGGKALLFENTGTEFPVLINAFGSDERMAMAIGREDLDEVGVEIESIFKNISDNKVTIFKKLSALPALFKLAGYLPSRMMGKGTCQQVIHRIPDLGILPVLKCWPYDGGRFITLPMVHTKHPESGKTNVGMYRMQVLDKSTTAMHWQRHKTGANHFEAWKKTNKKMPVSVALGGDPVYTYSATAPLPENINEYILAGFLRKKKVRMVKCLTNELYVPCDADIILEGYVDPAEEPVWEGPFGDHTGFYSLADWYPKFHVTCITHSKKAVYPATIVGIPPQEDAWLAKATEKIFLTPVKMTIQPEIEDFHMPDAGIAHNLLIVKIKKTYPGQGMKVISSLFGAGQMMFTKYLIVVSGDINIRNYKKLLVHVFANVDFGKDLLFSRGPLDVLDHSSDSFSFGGKAGVDATVKHIEEDTGRNNFRQYNKSAVFNSINNIFDRDIIKNFNLNLFKDDIPILIVTVNRSEDQDMIDKVKSMFKTNDPAGIFSLIVAVDHTVDPGDLHMVAWQVLGNSDPQRDNEYISPASVFIDGTIKAYRKGGFPRKWPNIVCSNIETISAIDQKWESLGIGPFINSPSIKNLGLCRNGTDEIVW
ncbi:MAG: menaquinone biosynthesis decarboxylase [Bacteroidales bacterium]|nr:menaquinone biosynthesis decarboxylase [Bacteroidales bacterium]MDP3002262.1 menaquinone biosynthesis decarboxylase [Bacteroidales bacterium]